MSVSLGLSARQEDETEKLLPITAKMTCMGRSSCDFERGEFLKFHGEATVAIH